MFLSVCATELELQPLLAHTSPGGEGWQSLVTGVGLVETTLQLSRFLEQCSGPIAGVLNFGVGGAYIRDGFTEAAVLDICLAERELFGDLGICHPDHIEPLPQSLLPHTSFSLDETLLGRAESALRRNGLSPRRGNFVTVCGVSGSTGRGEMLGRQYDGLCENMEGAAVARVCNAYDLPLVEVRAISNLVEDRDLSRWRLDEACVLAARAAAIIVEELITT
ncbi:MAG: futalosine hydrolase [Thermodesulfobacteriota bacterium]